MFKSLYSLTGHIDATSEWLARGQPAAVGQLPSSLYTYYVWQTLHNAEGWGDCFPAGHT
jgi:hypothetical protein